MQSYAELENNTPGQIFGVDSKNEGKSSSASGSSEPKTEKFTQRPKAEDTYYEPNYNNTNGPKADWKKYFSMGFVAVLIGYFLLFSESSPPEYHDESLGRQQAEQQSRKKSPFDEA